jgi:hypothetical protein
MTGGTLVMRAAVAQRTGEDWTGVRLGLSTADLDRRTDLPELRSLRIGRRQAAPAPSGWREPPSGLDELFSGYDAGARKRREHAERARTAVPASPAWSPDDTPATGSTLSGGYAVAAEYEDTDMSWMAEERYRGMSEPPPPPFAQAAPPPAPIAMASPAAAMPAPAQAYGAAAPAAPGGPPARARKSRRGAAPDTAMARESAGGGAMFDAAAPLAEAEPDLGPAQPGADLLDYAGLMLAGPDDTGARGRLRPAAGTDLVAREYQRRAEAVASLTLPAHAAPVRTSAGSYDYRFDVAARADVESDGGWHTVPVCTVEVGLEPEFVTVPAVDESVFGTVHVTNSSAHALLAGPADVSVGGEFLMTVPLPTLAPGERQRVGVGVVESVQVARRTHMRESTAGLRNQTTVLDHRVEIDVANHLGREIVVEVLERVPVSDEKDVKIEEHAGDPAWRRDEELRDGRLVRGARVWRLRLPANSTRTLTGRYEIRIPGGKAVVGGNRRA